MDHALAPKQFKYLAMVQIMGPGHQVSCYCLAVRVSGNEEGLAGVFLGRVRVRNGAPSAAHVAVQAALQARVQSGSGTRLSQRPNAVMCGSELSWLPGIWTALLATLSILYYLTCVLLKHHPNMFLAGALPRSQS